MVTTTKPVYFTFLFILLLQNLLFAQIAPLLSTKWDQGCYYNANCPSDAAGPCGQVFTGCNATALSQIFKYYSHPSSGWGSHSYTPLGYSLQSANFSSATYNWAAMPNTLSTANAEVAQIMYHIGVSVDMQYSPTVSNSSFSSLILNKYFKYSLSVSSRLKALYTTTQWQNIIRSELDAGRPVFVKGGPHFYIIDGYTLTPSVQFHCNFGWGGLYNGYYDISSIVITSIDITPTQVMIGIKPLTGLEASPDTVTINNLGGTVGYEIASNTPWTTSSDQSWLIPSIASGTAGYFSFSDGASASATTNSTYIPRYATISITDGTVTKKVVVKQNGKVPMLLINPNNLNYSSTGGGQSITLSCDSNWVITSSDPWLSSSPTTGSGNANPTVTATVNPSSSSRIGTVVITRGSLQQTISILQNGSGSFWCIPSMTTGGTNGITNVTLKSINRTSAINEGYINTGIGTTLKMDSTYTIYVTFAGSNAPAVWIDWNIDGDFNDAGEAIMSPSGGWYPSFAGTKNVSFTVPALIEGTTRMRVYAKAFGSGPVSSPCNTTDNGGCIEDYDITILNQKHITVTPSALAYTSSGGVQSLSVDSDSNWVVSTPATWLSLSPLSGIGNGSVNITAAVNSLTSPRSAAITFTRSGKTKIVNITQANADTILSTSPTSLNFLSTGGILSFNISSNVSYTIVASDPWISPSASSASGNTSIDVIVNNNPLTSTRSGSITISSGTISKIITITQDASSSILSTSPSSLSFTGAGGMQTVNLTTPGSWTITLSDGWFTIDMNAGTGNATIGITTSANTGLIRNGMLTITNGIITKSITITQDSTLAMALNVPEAVTKSDNIKTSESVVIYPNPSGDIITVDCKTMPTDLFNWKIFDLTGKVVLANENEFSETTQINLNSLEPGMYFISLTNSEGFIRKKFAKK